MLRLTKAQGPSAGSPSRDQASRAGRSRVRPGRKVRHLAAHVQSKGGHWKDKRSESEPSSDSSDDEHPEPPPEEPPPEESTAGSPGDGGGGGGLMDRLLRIVGDYNIDPRLGYGDSTTDQLNSVHTCFLMVTFGALIQAKYLFDTPVNCWCPAHFSKSQEEYTDSVSRYIVRSENVLFR